MKLKQSELIEIKEILLQQESLADKETLLKAIDIKEDDITLESIKALINLLQLNADSNDYLNRKAATTPIEFLHEIPSIYRAITLLLNFYHKIAENMILQKFKKDGISFKNQKNEIAEYLSKYRIALITNDGDKKDYEFWYGLRHYQIRYPENYAKNRAIYDRLDIDLILRKLHYSVLPLERAILLHSIKTQIQPSYITAETDNTIQYDSRTGNCALLLDRNFSGDISSRNWKCTDKDLGKNRGSYPLRLISTDISNCHTVLIKDDQDRFWMLHVSPASINGTYNNAFFETIGKQAYIDLHPNYENPQLGLQPGNIDVVVIDRGGYFNEKIFLNTLPKNVTVNSITVHSPDVSPEHQYCVCFLPENEKLVVMSIDGINKLIEYNTIFPKERPVSTCSIL